MKIVMKIVLGMIFGGFIGVLTAQVGYNIDSWQFWAIIIPGNLLIQPIIQLV